MRLLLGIVWLMIGVLWAVVGTHLAYEMSISDPLAMIIGFAQPIAFGLLAIISAIFYMRGRDGARWALILLTVYLLVSLALTVTRVRSIFAEQGEVVPTQVWVIYCLGIATIMLVALATYLSRRRNTSSLNTEMTH